MWPGDDRRSRAREIAMQALYQLDIRGSEILDEIADFIDLSENDPVCRELAKKWSLAAWQNVEQCDRIIEKSTVKWSLSRLSLVDKSILRLMVYQLIICEDFPPKVVINEAIELAKKYSADKSPSFINGILDAIMRKFPEKMQKFKDEKTQNKV